MTERSRRIGTRLAFEIPLTPWPVLIWIQSQGEYPAFGLHSATALYAVGNESLVAVLATAMLSLFVLMATCKDFARVAWWFIVVIANGGALYLYVISNAAVNP